MGNPVQIAGVSFLGNAAGSLVSSIGVNENAKATDRELLRQQREVNERARQDMSERARQADKEAAAAEAAFEDIGGSGSANEARVTAEVQADGGSDRATIEGNRRRKVEAIQFQKKANIADAQSKQGEITSSLFSSGLSFLGTDGVKAAIFGATKPTKKRAENTTPR